ncbi:MAG: tRNA threonylcarbamoyladenosine dehydratase [Verrucomicrobia bacterium]|nr:tRNA threonylcarbamoyladenosine dehydratase [Verrucomicrobiota bacterium]
MSDYDERFSRVSRLLSAEGMARLRAAHVAVVGLGGVGSWTVEALVRTGVGHLTLVDPDVVQLTNFNRQLPAMAPNLGRLKAEVLAERVRAINPDCRVTVVAEAFGPDNAARLLAPAFEMLVDAIDSPSRKAWLIAGCRERGIPILTVGGAGGRRDPTQVQVADLAATSHDPLLGQVRRLLRRHHGFPHGTDLFGVECVFSTEAFRSGAREAPLASAAVAGDHEPRECRRDARTTVRVVALREEAAARGAEDLAEALAAGRGRGFGTVCFVTGAFGLVAAARAVARITHGVSP